MFFGAVAVWLLICIGTLKWISRKPIELEEVRYLASRENLEVSMGASMHQMMYGHFLRCEYIHVPGEYDRLICSITYQRGRLMASFKDGRLIRWSDGLMVHEASDVDQSNYEGEAWMWKSILGTVEYAIAIEAGRGAQMV